MKTNLEIANELDEMGNANRQRYGNNPSADLLNLAAERIRVLVQEDMEPVVMPRRSTKGA
jgi:hypothetical protein